MPATDSSNGSPQKWALSIGIDRYPFLEKKDKDGNVLSHKDLSGCVNDARLLRGVLAEQFGFPPENMTLLTDEAATREGILQAMNALAERVAEDDIVVVTYAGHGSLMADREGDEADGKDSTIVPYDSGRVFDELNQYPNRDISDDEIYVWLKKVTGKTPYVTLIFDCCKSGTIARDVFGEADRWVDEDTRSVDDLPPSPLAAEEISLLQRGDRGESGWLPVEDRYVLIAGCRVVETAGEYRVPGTRERNGLMTYFLAQELKNATPGTTYRDVYERMVPAILANAKQPQHPQMEGTRDRELFGVRDIRPMDYVKVAERIGTTVVLAAGGALGMTAGSEWTVYPEGTKEVTDETEALGRVKVTAVRAVTSDAVILEESSPNAVSPAGRAVETVRAFGDPDLLVQVVVPDDAADLAKTFADELAYSYANLLRLVAPDEGADARVYLIPPRTEVHDGDPVPQLGPVGAATWAVVGIDGDLLMPLHPRDEQPNPIVTILDNLSLIAKARRVHTIVSNKKPNPLDGKVRVVLKKQQADGAWVEARPEKDGLPVYQDGDNLEITLVNDYEKPVYVYLLNIGLDYSIAQLYPPARGANEALAPNTSYDVGMQGYGVPLPLGVPDTFPHDEGVNTPILFVTLEEADFGGLTQPGVRDVDELSSFRGDASELGQLLSLSLVGGGTRNIILPQKKTDEPWTAVKAGFILQR